MPMPASKACWAFSGPAWMRSRRSPPAKKVFLAEVKMMPRIESFSASSAVGDRGEGVA